MAHDAATAQGPDRSIRYFVNTEPEFTTEHHLTGRQILEGAGFKPAEDYQLVRNDGDKPIGPDDREEIHKDEGFTATFVGPTPTSYRDR